MDIALDSVLKSVNEFVSKTRGAPKSAIHADTQLFQEGHLDSFGLVELIALLEKDLSIELPASALIPDDFESPRVLWMRLQQI